MTLDVIHGDDPGFDQTAFLSRAEAVLALVLRARSEGRPEQARAVVSQGMAMRLSAELDGLRAAGEPSGILSDSTQGSGELSVDGEGIVMPPAPVCPQSSVGRR